MSDLIDMPAAEYGVARTRLEAALADPSLCPTLRADAHYALWEVCQACGDPVAALAHLDRAIGADPVQRRPVRGSAPTVRTVLAIAARGDFQANLPLSMLLDHSTLLRTLWIERPGGPLPSLPDADCVFVSIGEDRRHRALLADADRIARRSTLPVINSGARIARMSRDGVCALLDGLPDRVVPPQRRVAAAALRRQPPVVPSIVRPAGSHAGIGLALIDTPTAMNAYLDECEGETELFVAPFVDYRSADGRYRKYRVVFVDRKPFPVHLAIHHDWAVWYYNARMELCAEKRAEEGRFLRDIGAAIGARAMAALRTLGQRLDLDYVGLDCAVLPDGRLLVFEVETGMLVHDRDPVDLFPDKAPAIGRIVSAVNAMIDRRIARASEAAVKDGGGLRQQV